MQSDYEILVEKNGINVVKTATKRLPGIILLDIIMPEISGYDVIRELKASEETRDIPVIFISGLNDIEDIEKGLEHGAVDYIIKPFKPKDVRTKVKKHIIGQKEQKL